MRRKLLDSFRVIRENSDPSLNIQLELELFEPKECSPMEWLMHDVGCTSSQSRWPVLLLVCPNLDRMQSHENALHAAGYAVACASTIIAAHEMSQLCKFDIVLLDHECASEEKAGHLQEKYVSVLLERGTTERELLLQLSQILQVASASAAVQ